LASKTTQGQAYALVDLYGLCFKEKYQRAAVLNKYRDKWGFQDMVESIGYDDSIAVVKYYFETESPGHKLNVLFSNFDKMLQAMQARELDRANRARIRQQTQKVVEEWENSL
jgi:hypothetical protein